MVMGNLYDIALPHVAGERNSSLVKILNSKTVGEFRVIAKERGLCGYSKFRKKELVFSLSSSNALCRVVCEAMDFDR